MSLYPVANFPLRASDQADIIELFLDLMRNNDPASAPSQVASHPPADARNHAAGPWLPGDLPDLA